MEFSPDRPITSPYPASPMPLCFEMRAVVLSHSLKSPALPSALFFVVWLFFPTSGAFQEEEGVWGSWSVQVARRGKAAPGLRQDNGKDNDVQKKNILILLKNLIVLVIVLSAKFQKPSGKLPKWSSNV